MIEMTLCERRAACFVHRGKFADVARPLQQPRRGAVSYCWECFYGPISVTVAGPSPTISSTASSSFAPS